MQRPSVLVNMTSSPSPDWKFQRLYGREQTEVIGVIYGRNEACLSQANNWMRNLQEVRDEMQGRPVGRIRGRLNRGIVEECCFRSCDLNLLETYCAKSVKSERDLSSSSLVVLPALNKDPFQKPSLAKYSKYDIWQKKSSQRLQRGAPQHPPCPLMGCVSQVWPHTPFCLSNQGGEGGQMPLHAKEDNKGHRNTKQLTQKEQDYNVSSSISVAFP
ncbi:hypothetical protein lerEdw1_005310 [Lerista edwardsae]|nr:hypothetical protein lerEdw1_005310 [Lerista edwardsae]